MLTDDEILAAIEHEEALSQDSMTGELQRERADALDRYRGLPLGNEVDGRSQVVDKSVFDTIEWIMPSLARIYLGGDEIGRFEARGPQDEEAAKRETEVCNWYLEAKNDFFSQINSTLRDALLLKNGYMVGYWQCKYDTMTETYKGLADEEVAMLAQDSEVEIVEHSEYPDPNVPQGMVGGAPPQGGTGVGHALPDPALAGGMPAPMLHDVKVERKTCEEFVQVESIPPEELRVSRRHRWTSLLDADFVQWRRRVSIGQLRAEGFKVPDEMPSDEDWNQEWVERERYLDVRNQDDMTPDPSRRMVTFKDTYMRIDLRGKGTQQLWRFCSIKGSEELLLKEEVDIVPFAAFSPIIYPHSHVGMSVYDLINDIGVIKTTLQRQFLDGSYLSTNGQKVVDQTRVNMDDLLVSRPGGIIRVDGGDPGTAIMPLAVTDMSASVLSALEYMDGVKEQRTGVTRYSAGLDANTLNKTATGVQAIQSAANQRIELIARTLAGGFKDLFLIVHALTLKHSTKAIQIKLRGDWTTVNPREWTRRTDFSISVGLGTGTPEQQVQKLMAMTPIMQGAQAMGLAGPQEIYNYSAEMWKAAGYKNPEKFIHQPQKDPQTGQPVQPPQRPDPHVQAAQVKAQSDQQIAQVKGQADMQLAQAKMQADGQLEQVKMQMNDQLEQQKMLAARDKEQAQMQADMQTEMQKAQLTNQLELERARMQLELDGIKHGREQQTAIQVAQIHAQASIQVAEINAGAKAAADGDKAKGEQKDATMQQILQHMTAPRKIIRDQNGRVAGMEVVSKK